MTHAFQGAADSRFGESILHGVCFATATGALENLVTSKGWTCLKHSEAVLEPLAGILLLLLCNLRRHGVCRLWHRGISLLCPVPQTIERFGELVLGR